MHEGKNKNIWREKCVLKFCKKLCFFGKKIRNQIRFLQRLCQLPLKVAMFLRDNFIFQIVENLTFVEEETILLHWKKNNIIGSTS